MRGDSGVAQKIIDEIHSPDMERFQMHGESSLTRSIVDEFHS